MRIDNNLRDSLKETIKNFFEILTREESCQTKKSIRYSLYSCAENTKVFFRD